MAKALFLKLLGMLPLPLVHALGAALGMLFYLIPNRRRRTARINLALCFPELSSRQRRRLWRRTLVEFGKTVTEVAVLWTCSEARLRRLVKEVAGEEHVREAYARKGGVIFALPHLGAWELVSLYCSLHYPLSSLYRPLDNARADRQVREARERFGAMLVPADASGVRALYKRLEKAETVLILPDQTPAARGGGVFAPFFGISADTTVLLSRLAIKTKAPVFFAYARRLPWGRGYALHFTRAPDGIHQDDVAASATVVNAMVEQCARTVPEQYQWIYKRFRSRPPGEKKIY